MTNIDKKICHISSAHKSSDVRIFEKECSSLAKQGYKTYLVCADAVNDDVNNVKIRSIFSKSENRLYRFIKTSYLVYKKGLSLNADLYHIHDPELIPWGLLMKLKGKKIIYDSHEDFPKQILSKHWINIRIRKQVSLLVSFLEFIFLRFFDAIITATPSIKESLAGINDLTIDVNNYPVFDSSNYSFGSSKKDNKICYVGLISELRGIIELVKAIESMDVELVLAGPFSNKKIENELSTLSGWKKVNYLGYQDRSGVNKILNMSKVGIVTFLPEANHIDSQPNKMFEYMSASLPVITSNFPLWKEIVEENKCGICVNPQNPTEISLAIKYLLDNSEEAKKMGQNGLESVKNRYNWSVEEKKLLNLYGRLL